MGLTINTIHLICTLASGCIEEQPRHGYIYQCNSATVISVKDDRGFWRKTRVRLCKRWPEKKGYTRPKN